MLPVKRMCKLSDLLIKCCVLLLGPEKETPGRISDGYG